MWKRLVRKILALQSHRGPESEVTLSTRAMGEKFGMSSGCFSELQSGKRRLTDRTALTLVNTMVMTDDERSDLKMLMRARSPQNPVLPETLRKSPQGGALHLEILACLDFDKAPADVDAIAALLGRTSREVSDAWNELLAFQLIERYADGTYRRAFPLYGLNETSIVLAKPAQAGSAESLDSGHHFASLVFAGNSEQIARANQALQKALVDVFNALTEGPLDTVFRVNSKLLAVTIPN